MSEEAQRVQEFIAGLPRVSRRFLRELQKRGTMTTVEAQKALSLRNLHHVWGSVFGPLVAAFYDWEEVRGSQLRLYDTEYLERVAVGKMKGELAEAGNRRWAWVYQGELDWAIIDRLANPTRRSGGSRSSYASARVLSRPEQSADCHVPVAEAPPAREPVSRRFEPDESRRGTTHQGTMSPGHEPGRISGAGGRPVAARRPAAAGIFVEIKGKPGTGRRL